MKPEGDQDMRDRIIAILKKIRSHLFMKDTVLFHEFYLKNLTHSWIDPHGVIFERYKAKDSRLLETTIEELHVTRLFTMEEVDERIRQGHLLYVAKKDGNIIGFYWVARGRLHIPFFEGTLDLKPDEFYSFNVYLDGKYRGLGINNRLKAYIFNDLRKQGYKRAIGSYYAYNKANHRANVKFGSVPLGYLTYANILTLRYQYSTVRKCEILFDCGPLVLWKKMFRKLKAVAHGRHTRLPVKTEKGNRKGT